MSGFQKARNLEGQIGVNEVSRRGGDQREGGTASMHPYMQDRQTSRQIAISLFLSRVLEASRNREGLGT